LLRRDVPSREQLGTNRPAVYIKYVKDGCECLFVLEDRETFDPISSNMINVVWIHSLRTYPEKECQGKGLGSHVMRTLVTFADQYGLHLQGDVVPYGDTKMDQEGMAAFDARFGLLPLKAYAQHVNKDDWDEYRQEDFDEILEDSTLVWRPPIGYMP